MIFESFLHLFLKLVAAELRRRWRQQRSGQCLCINV